MFWQYAVIILILIFISLVVIKMKRKDFSVEINKLIQYLGGKENIIESQINLSRLKVVVKDVGDVPFEDVFHAVRQDERAGKG